MIDESLLDSLRELAEAADAQAVWPERSWQSLADAGLLRYGIPSPLGGEDRTASETSDRNEALSGACLTTAFILSQREAAVRRLLVSDRADLQRQYLPRAATGQIYLTVGLSQLTTSRQHRAPSLVADPDGDGYRVQGEIPWVTGASQAEAIVVGATLPDDSQILFLLPKGHAGVTIDPPMALSSLLGSLTSSVRCEGVRIGRDLLLAGPAPQILGPAGGGGLETSCLALGLASAAIDWLAVQGRQRPEAADAALRLGAVRDGLRADLHRLTREKPGVEVVLKFRTDCSMLAMRATQVALIVAKGNGFVAPHPVQRWARQALFFLVWSCPRSVSDGLLGELLPG